jgi:hypothetical protein
MGLINERSAVTNEKKFVIPWVLLNNLDGLNGFDRFEYRFRQHRNSASCQFDSNLIPRQALLFLEQRLSQQTIIALAAGLRTQSHSTRTKNCHRHPLPHKLGK